MTAAATFGPKRTASVRFPVVESSSRSRKLLMEMSTAESRPVCRPNKSASRGQPPVWMNTRAGHRDQPEEEDHKQLAHAAVGQRERSAGIAVGEEQRGNADGHDRPAARLIEQHAADDRDAEKAAAMAITVRGCSMPEAVTRSGPRRRSVSAPLRASMASLKKFVAIWMAMAPSSVPEREPRIESCR